MEPGDLRRPAHIDAWVVVAGRVTYGYDVPALAAEQTVRGKFLRAVLSAADLSEDDRHRVLMTGLRAFDGRDDLEVR